MNILLFVFMICIKKLQNFPLLADKLKSYGNIFSGIKAPDDNRSPYICFTLSPQCGTWPPPPSSSSALCPLTNNFSLPQTPFINPSSLTSSKAFAFCRVLWRATAQVYDRYDMSCRPTQRHCENQVYRIWLLLRGLFLRYFQNLPISDNSFLGNRQKVGKSLWKGFI